MLLSVHHLLSASRALFHSELIYLRRLFFQKFFLHILMIGSSWVFGLLYSVFKFQPNYIQCKQLWNWSVAWKYKAELGIRRSARWTIRIILVVVRLMVNLHMGPVVARVGTETNMIWHFARAPYLLWFIFGNLPVSCRGINRSICLQSMLDGAAESFNIISSAPVAVALHAVIIRTYHTSYTTST